VVHLLKNYVLCRDLQRIQKMSELLLTYISGIETPCSFQIIDIEGRMVRSGVTSSNNIQTNLGTGYYFLKLTNNQLQRSFRFIVE